ncbi:LuxR C-terminal-related transcriptional regulator [Streptomyces sp. NPDC005438]|uniref:LuxR C-terminal-related transcriptional regulator n=1 Tax=Streptomyces sp. NPDC005438 TaxID=3156880 RepID=UPI0033B88569
MSSEDRPLVGRGEQLATVDRVLGGPAAGPAVLELAGDPGSGKTRLLTEIARRVAETGATLGDLTTDTPGHVLLVDDAHALGPGELRRLTALLRAAPAARRSPLLVVAHRPRQSPPTLLAALAGARRDERSYALTLEDFDATTSEEFAGTGLCRRHGDELYPVAGGNPRYLEVLVAACGGPERCEGDELSPRRLPARWSAPLLAEVDALGAHARTVAHAAAVLGEESGPALLAPVARLDPDSVLAAVDELVAADLLRPTGDAGSLRFRHPVVRQVVYAHLPIGWRMVAHRHAAEALRAAGHPPERYAPHLAYGALGEDEASATVLTAAAETTHLNSPARAAHWLRTAADLLPPSPTRHHRRLDLLVAAARAAVLAGRPARAVEALDAHDRLATTGDRDPGTAAVAAEQRALLASRDGHVTLARDLALGALDALDAVGESAPPAGAAASLWVLLAATASREAGEASRTWADEAVRAATAGTGGTDDGLRAHARALRGLRRLADGATEDALREALASARLADRQPDERLAAHLPALACLGRLESLLDHHGPAVRHLTRGLDIARRGDQWPAAAELAAELGRVYLRQGRLTEAAEQAEEAVRRADLSRGTDLRAMALCLRADVALQIHEPATSAAVAHAACLVAPAESPWWPRAHIALAAARSALGDARGAHEALAVARLLSPDTAPLPLPERIALAGTVCAVELALGHTDAARRVAAWARRSADDTAPASLRVASALPTALLCEDPATAVAVAERALVDAASCGQVLDEARARIAAARALAHLGERDRAVRHLDLAAATDGARLAAEVTAAREAVDAVRTGGGEHAIMLSQREFEISTLVSRGRTNQQIARLLGVSHKTVETHLGRIFTKLKVSSRAEIANLIGRNTVVARPRRRAAARPDPALAGVS